MSTPARLIGYSGFQIDRAEGLVTRGARTLSPWPDGVGSDLLLDIPEFFLDSFPDRPQVEVV